MGSFGQRSSASMIFGARVIWVLFLASGIVLWKLCDSHENTTSRRPLAYTDSFANHAQMQGACVHQTSDVEGMNQLGLAARPHPLIILH